MRDVEDSDLFSLTKGYPEYDPDQSRGDDGKWTGGWGTSARTMRRHRQREREAAEREGRAAPKPARAKAPKEPKAPKKPSTTEGKPRARAKTPAKVPAAAPKPRQRRPRPTPPAEVTIGELKPQDPPEPVQQQPEPMQNPPVVYAPPPEPEPQPESGLARRDREQLEREYARYDDINARMNEADAKIAETRRMAPNDYAAIAHYIEIRRRARSDLERQRKVIEESETRLRSANKRFRKVDKSLYMCRYLKNADEFRKWAKGAGFKTVADPDELHATVAYSKQALPWPTAKQTNVVVRATDGRTIKRFGDAVVMTFPSQILTDRWQQLRNRGASWEHPEYEPHVTITYNAPADLDLSRVRPFDGPLVFGPEHMEEITDGYRPTEKRLGFHFHKNDKELGLVFGWAIICSENGEPYYDTQGDYIPEDSMLEAAADFMANRREMKLMHSGRRAGNVVFAWPVTEDIAEAMGIEGKRTGLMVAVKPDNPSVLQRFRDGRYTGFSIGGNRLIDEDADDDDT